MSRQLLPRVHARSIVTAVTAVTAVLHVCIIGRIVECLPDPFGSVAWPSVLGGTGRGGSRAGHAPQWFGSDLASPPHLSLRATSVPVPTQPSSCRPREAARRESPRRVERLRRPWSSSAMKRVRSSRLAHWSATITSADRRQL